MENHKLYLIGGYIRDALMKKESKDKDYSFVFEDVDYSIDVHTYFDEMHDILEKRGVRIYQRWEDAFIIRGRYEDEDVDFVMARRETYPDPNTRQPLVTIGNLHDDLERRDFTVNSMAVEEGHEISHKNLIDPFGGRYDLMERTLNCTVSLDKSFRDDGLRLIRALRFMVTKNFKVSPNLHNAMFTDDTTYYEVLSKHVSVDRINEELSKMFKYDTVRSLKILNLIKQNNLSRFFENGLWLKPTTEKIK